MRAVIQRVAEAKVEVEGRVIGAVGRGLLVYLGVAKEDAEADAQFMADKLANLRIFADEAGKMNRSVIEIGGGVLLVSNFTLQGDCRKGRRPGFDAAADPQLAEPLVPELLRAREQLAGVLGLAAAVEADADEVEGPRAPLPDLAHASSFS